MAAPTSDRHDYVIEEWLEALKKQTYKNFDILLVDTSEKNDFYKYLKNKGLRVIRNKWNPDKGNAMQHLANSREIYRKIAVKENYDYLFNLDTDTILPENGIEKLMSFDKDQVGYLVHVYPKAKWIYQPPCVFKEGGFNMNQKKDKDNGLQYYSWSWTYKYKNKLRRVYASALGVLLVKRKVFKEVPFRSHPTFIWGEDLWYYAEAHEKGFEAYCYVKRITHKNTTWDDITNRETKRLSVGIAVGPVDSNDWQSIDKNIDIVRV